MHLIIIIALGYFFGSVLLCGAGMAFVGFVNWRATRELHRLLNPSEPKWSPRFLIYGSVCMACIWFAAIIIHTS
jgi:hypothetical protein